MILTELRDYLKQHGRVSAMDMAYKFEVEPDVIRSMVAKWVKKGLVEEVDAPTKCDGCCKCDSKKNEVYQWKAKSIA